MCSTGCVKRANKVITDSKVTEGKVQLLECVIFPLDAN